MIRVDFTCTAMPRPEVFKRMIVSLRKNISGIRLSDCSLFLNVDPSPGEPSDGPGAEAVFSLSSVFRNTFSRFAGDANFAAAVRWCLGQSAADYVFHLEDDWLFEKPFDIADMIEAMESHDVDVVNLRAYMWPASDRRICLSPGLWRGDAARLVASRLTDDANPEKQLRPIADDNPDGGRHKGLAGIRFPLDTHHIVIRDIGRKWMQREGVKKDEDSPHWNCWEAA